MLAVTMIAALVVAVLAGLAAALTLSAGWWALVVVAGVLLAVAVRDVVQRRHSLLRIYPVLGHLRFLGRRTGRPPTRTTSARSRAA